MEIVICKLTTETVDQDLPSRLRDKLPNANVVIARCINCCGDCASEYVVLQDGKPIQAKTFEELADLLISPRLD